MDEKIKRKLIINYFTAKFPGWTIFLIIVGVILFFSSFGFFKSSVGGGVFLLFIGLLLIGLSILGIIKRKKSPTDSQFDEWINEDLALLQKKALNKTGIDESQLVGAYVPITGFPWSFNLGGSFFSYKKGKDNILRFTPIECTILNFTENQIIVYKCFLDLSTGNSLNESTDEYFYKDVVSVSTKSESKTINLGVKLGTFQTNEAEMFSLTTSGGTSISVLLRDRSLITKLGGGEMPTNKAEQAIQVVRKMLRDKKS